MTNEEALKFIRTLLFTSEIVISQEDYSKLLESLDMILSAIKKLEKLEEVFYKIGCELSNINFLDDDCKIMTLERIRSIYNDK